MLGGLLGLSGVVLGGAQGCGLLGLGAFLFGRGFEGCCGGAGGWRFTSLGIHHFAELILVLRELTLVQCGLILFLCSVILALHELISRSCFRRIDVDKLACAEY